MSVDLGLPPMLGTLIATIFPLGLEEIPAYDPCLYHFMRSFQSKISYCRFLLMLLPSDLLEVEGQKFPLIQGLLVGLLQYFEANGGFHGSLE